MKRKSGEYTATQKKSKRTRDVISGALSLGLDQDRKSLGVLSVPGSERLEELEPVGGRVDDNLDGRSVSRRGGVGVLSRVVTVRRELLSIGVGELEVLSVSSLERIGEGVEGERSSEDHGGDEIRGSDESVGVDVGIVPSGEVSVVGSDDGVSRSLGNILSVPLSDARTTGVGKYDTSSLLEDGHLSVTGDGGTNLLRSGGDGETGLGGESVVGGFLGNGGGTGHVLVRRVGAGSNQTDRELVGPVVSLDSGSELGERGGKIRSVRSVDVGLKLGEVDLDNLVVLGSLVSSKVVGEGLGVLADVGTVGGIEVSSHTVVVGEEGSGGTDFSSHVTDGSHSSAG